MLEFLGRFHPVFVHLPIGILLLACIFILLSLKAKFAHLKASIAIMLLLGALSAVASCITGYFLANNGDYDGDLVDLHQWMGISVAIISIILYFIHQKVTSTKILATIAVLLIVLISITGHLGGSLTHGADYLTAPIDKDDNTSAILPIPNIQEAMVYRDAIQPLLKARCYSCHGSEKQKGKLRLDEESFILKGGKTGLAIMPNKAEESELMKRINLPLTSEGHMAPKEKPQLTENEIKLIRWWIENGASFTKKFKDLPQNEDFKAILTSLQKGENINSKVKTLEIPVKEVSMADTEVLKKLTDLGITVFPITQNTNYLSANFVNAKAMDKSILDLIKSIDKQLIWLKLDNKLVNNESLNAISSCKNLTKLSLNYSKINDQGLSSLKNLDQLQSLSLVGTNISLKGIEQLKKLKNLKTLYLYQTKLNSSNIGSLRQILPQVKIDMGNYQVPTLAQDTTEVKAPKA